MKVWIVAQTDIEGGIYSGSAKVFKSEQEADAYWHSLSGYRIFDEAELVE